MKRFKDFNRLYEFEENAKSPSAEKTSFMDKLYDRIKKEANKSLSSSEYSKLSNKYSTVISSLSNTIADSFKN